MRSADYFEAHPVFCHADFVAAHTAGGRSAFTSNNLLARHLGAGRLVRVRRGLYAVVPRGVDPDQATVDPYLVASHLTGDSGVAYHAALQFFGCRACCSPLPAGPGGRHHRNIPRRRPGARHDAGAHDGGCP